MRPLLEAVPNVSEGRDRATLEALTAAFGEHARVLDAHTDEDHHRTVFTLVAEAAALEEALVAGVACAQERIDLRRHAGAHPRIGAADVVPVVPLRPEEMPLAREAALRVAERVGDELGLPVFLYGEVGGGRGPAFFRRGGTDELARRLEAGELRPDFGPPRLDPAAGGVLVGARRPLIAFNVELGGAGLEVARELAALVREGGGGFRGVRALGLELPRSGRVQVSMNVEDHEAVGLAQLVARLEEEAARRGARLERAEVVGLIPAAALPPAGESPLLDALGADRVLERRLVDE